MNRLKFKLNQALKVGEYSIPYDAELTNQENQIAGSGIRKESKLRSFIKTVLYPVYSLRNYLLVDGFVERKTGKLIKKYIRDNTVFLEVGCGNMSLRRFLPRNLFYNAIDISLSEFILRRILREGERINVALCSATRISLDSSTVSLIVSTEVLEHIPAIDIALSDIYRVLKPEGILIVSIPNNYCYKYHKKGPHSEHVNNWTFYEFKEYMNQHGFKCLEGCMMGYWIPLPLWLTKTSYQLPISSKEEFYNTNFFFVFQKPKKELSSRNSG